MKKVFLASASLIVLAVSISIFQISCQKEVQAQSGSNVLKPATTSTLGGVIPDGTTISVDANGKISCISSAVQDLLLFSVYIENGGASHTEIWTSKLDGTNKKKVSITVPSGFDISDSDVKMLPDRQRIVFVMYSSAGSTYVSNVYTCKLDGSDLKKIISGEDIPSSKGISLGGAY